MKIKDIISELQRFNPDDNCVIIMDDESASEDFDIKPDNGTRHNVAIAFQSSLVAEQKKEIAGLEESIGDFEEKLEAVEALVFELVEIKEETAPVAAVEIIEKLAKELE